MPISIAIKQDVIDFFIRNFIEIMLYEKNNTN
jgi:hypothetical protein